MKTKSFSVILACFYLITALGLVFFSCKEAGGTTTAYTVSFNANGGSGAVPGPIAVNAGSGITIPNGDGLSKSGYTFGGWNTNIEGTGTNYSAGSSFTPTGHITLYAKWNAVGGQTTYTVTFNANGGSGTPPAEQTVNAGSGTTLPSGDGLSKSGYTFGGWNTNDSGTGTNYSAGSSYTPTGSITLYAKWNTIAGANICTVSFNANGGSGTVPAQTVNAGSSITLPSGSGLTKSNSIFAGWNTNTSGTGTDYNAGSSYIVNGHITFYAKWLDAGVPICTVRFETNGGSPVGNAVILQYAVVNRPSPNPTRTGYTFNDWFSNPELTEAYNFSSIVVIDITLYAKWNPITYTISYNKNASDATGTIQNSSHTYDVDQNLNANAFYRKGYSIAGWARTPTGAAEFTDGEAVKNLSAVLGATVPRLCEKYSEKK